MLVGRDTELASLRGLLVAGRRVTVAGSPGIGKTALIRAAVEGREHRWVDLDGARTSTDLWGALSHTFGLNLDQPARAPAAVAWALRDTPVVVLDGAELLEPAAWAALDQLRAELPQVCQVVGAVVGPAPADIQLGPLSVEETRRVLLAQAAVRAPGRPIDASDPVWTTLAEGLDGLPLAIELAAGRLSWMTPQDLVGRLEAAVVRGSDRRTSVEGALRFGWSLLGPEDQRALVRLSLARGFTLVLAEALLGDDALGVLERLRTRSALTVREGRLVMLEGLRRIAVAEVDDEVRRHFVRAWAARAVALRMGFRSGAQIESARELRIEQGNLRAAADQALAIGDPGSAIPIIQAVVLSLRISGPLWQVEELPDLVALARSVEGAGAAELVAHLGGSLLHLGQSRRAREVLAVCLELAEPLGPVSLARSTALADLGLMAVLEGDAAAARALLERALEAAPDDVSAALVLTRMATACHIDRDHEGAVRSLEVALARLQGAESPRLRGTVRLNLGLMLVEQGRRSEGEDLLRSAVRELEPVEAVGQALAAMNLGLVHIAYGEPEGAGEWLDLSYAIQARAGSQVSLGLAAIGCALSRWASGDRDAARERLVEATDRLREVDPVGTAMARAWRAALQADSGHPETLGVELDAARADGADPLLVEVLRAFGSGDPPAPAPTEVLEVRIARRLLRRGPPALRCDRGGRWFERPGDRVDLARRGALRRILAALIDARVTRPGAGLTVQDLFEAGWPGDRAMPDAAAARVYNAVRELRTLGVGDVLRREAEGYLLAADARIDVEA